MSYERADDKMDLNSKALFKSMQSLSKSLPSHFLSRARVREELIDRLLLRITRRTYENAYGV